MPTLGDHSNVFDTAFAVMQRKGYRVWYEPDSCHWGAERDGWDFLAYSPTALLGLIAIHDFIQPTEFREYWWRIDDPNADSRNLPAKPEYQPVFLRSKSP